MSLQALTAYLSIQKPGHAIDSAYQLHHEYRLAEATVISQLQAHGYTRVTTFTPAPPPSDPSSTIRPKPIPRHRWVKQETQLDRIERKLDQLLSSQPQTVTIYSEAAKAAVRHNNEFLK